MHSAKEHDIPLHFSRSTTSTRANKTGLWRYVEPFYEEKTAPCSAACPAGEDIPRIEMLIARGRQQEALSCIFEENPFPAICGHVCFHPCETACNRGFFDDPVAVHHLERYLGYSALREEISAFARPQPSNGRRVGIVGAGPAGLAAAYFFKRLGYDCDVYEAESSPGGVLRYGIPTYRLPEDVVEKETARISNLGVRFFFNRKIEQDFLNTACGDYHALVVAGGLSHAVQLNIPGENSAQKGLDLLRMLRTGRRPDLKGSAAVIGGGNTAVDVARTLIRLGVESHIVYRRRKIDMPAFNAEVRAAEAEGVRIAELVSPIAMEKDGQDIQLTLQKMRLQKPSTPESRARVTASNSRPQTLRVQYVITAVGSEPDVCWVPASRQDAEVMRLDHCTLTFNGLPIVYCGDLVNRVQSVPDAVASGKAAAMAVDTYFNEGWDWIESRLSKCRIGGGPALSMAAYAGSGERRIHSQTVMYRDLNSDYFSAAARTEPATAAVHERIGCFDAVLTNLSSVEAGREAERCFNCGRCNDCGNCELFCPDAAVMVNAGRKTINLDYCKGCGVCVVECPRNVMSLKEAHHEADS